MPSDGSRLLIILLFFSLIRAFYTICEYTIIEVNDSKVRDLAENNPRFKPLYKLISNPAKMITAFSAHRIISALCIGVTMLAWMNKCFKLEGITAFLGNCIVVAAGTIIISVLTDVFPKRIADKKIDETVAAGLTPFVNAIIVILSPFTAVINALSFILCKIFRLSTRAKIDVVTEEEILMMVEAGNETGVIEESQREMINNIFEFGDVMVSEIMTHRVDVVGLDINDKISDIIYLAINKGFSRMPVYEGTIDKIIGIIYVKDFLCLVGCEKPEEFRIKDFMRKALYIPATNKCDEVFEIMTKKKLQMAIVVDEYGGTAGIVTMEDILEEIVGNIQDEYDEEEQDINEVSEGVYIIAGSADPEDILPILHVKPPEIREHEYDTMSAMIVDLLGRIPSESETPVVIYDNIEFTVLLTEDNWISKIKATVLEKNINKSTDD